MSAQTDGIISSFKTVENGVITSPLGEQYEYVDLDNVTVSSVGSKPVDTYPIRISGGLKGEPLKIDGLDLAKSEEIQIHYQVRLKTEASMDTPADNKITITAYTDKDDQTSTEGETTRSVTPFTLLAKTVLEETAKKPLAVGGYNFQKVETHTDAPLEGAKFVIFDTDKDNPDQSGYVKFVEENGRNALKWVQNIEEATVYESNEEGKIALEYLPYGEYELVEIKAPSGHVKSDKRIEFTVVKDSIKIRGMIQSKLEMLRKVYYLQLGAMGSIFS